MYTHILLIVDLAPLDYEELIKRIYTSRIKNKKSKIIINYIKYKLSLRQGQVISLNFHYQP
jgi:hypothetical protein